MTDLKQRLTDSLAEVGGRAPIPGDLATGAHSRLRRRRRTTAAAVAAAVAVVSVPLGVALVEGGGQSTDRQDPAVVDSVPSDWRVESYRDLTLRVPPDWSYGGGTDWCLDGQDPQSAQPQVSRAGGAVRAIACRPAYGYGVVFAPQHLDVFLGDETFPSDAHYDTFGTEQARVWIAAQTEEQLQQILASIEPITDADPNGCPIPTTRVFGHTNPASICRYAADGNLLEQSERLSADQTGALRRSLASAPEQTRGRACGGVGNEYVLVLIDGRKVQVFYDARCPAANGAIINGRRVELTEDILYWVLSPGWSGSVGPGVPLPEELRTLD